MLGLIRAGEGRGGGRDLRADVFRGLALWFIFIDHVPGNLLGGFTLRNVALCDAPEAFVLLAGYAAGLAYGAMAERQGWIFASAALLRRVGTLYIAHIFLFVVFTAQVGYSVAALDSVAYIRFASVYKEFAEPADFQEFAGAVSEADSLEGQAALFPLRPADAPRRATSKS